MGTLSRLLVDSRFVPRDRENAHVEISGSDRHFARYAADLPRAVYQQTQVGKASIGKAPLEKAPVGKSPLVKG
jgi:hypothetical protein